ncbi:hypothetical protein H2199_009003 [Coniosporium tulheliwenetii]|uniref:Uncharacterized protein n=1 Tax=Coniosporium tulheliwenetii TaxID=3383036 RepID=A0ACC2YHD1_9PEZI|nr:hypothetical protein H2199_009003 [Cladosporium sp. JES 115]
MLTENTFTKFVGVDNLKTLDTRRLPVAYEPKSFYLINMESPASTLLVSLDDVARVVSQSEQALESPFEGFNSKSQPTDWVYRRLIKDTCVGPGKLTDADARAILDQEARYIDLTGDGALWTVSGRNFYAPEVDMDELGFAGDYFFVPHQHVDPFDKPGASTATASNPPAPALDYRVLSPTAIMDINGNIRKIIYDTFRVLIVVAVMGKRVSGPPGSDSIEDGSLADIMADLNAAVMTDLFTNPTRPGLYEGGVLVNKGLPLDLDGRWSGWSVVSDQAAAPCSLKTPPSYSVAPRQRYLPD